MNKLYNKIINLSKNGFTLSISFDPVFNRHVIELSKGQAMKCQAYVYDYILKQNDIDRIENIFLMVLDDSEKQLNKLIKENKYK